MNGDSTYWLPEEFLNGLVVEHCRELLRGSSFRVFFGCPFYNAVVLAIVTTNQLGAEEQIDDGVDVYKYKRQKITIDGTQFLSSYKKGFNDGLTEFENNYGSKTHAIYSDGEDNLTQNLRRHYKHERVDGPSWETSAIAIPLLINKKAVVELGRFAGLCYGVDRLIYNHPHLSDAIHQGLSNTIFQTDFNAKPLSYNSTFSSEQVRQIIFEILAPLNGLNPLRQKIMDPTDFSRLMEYTEYLVTHNSVPQNIEVIEQINISDRHISFTFHRLHQHLFTTKRIRPSFIEFLHVVFRQFETYKRETTRKQFKTKPASYDIDFNIS